MPVFPLVGSIIVESFFILPSFMACLIIPSAVLSLMLPAGLKNSSFARISAFKFSSFFMFFKLYKGVFPIKSK